MGTVVAKLRKHLSIDETMLCKDLFTFLTNKDGHGRRGSLIAVVKGTTSEEVVKHLMKLSEDKRLAVEEVTMDFSYSMFSIVSQAFPNATIVIDCFHVMMRLGEALEEMRMKMKRQAQSELKREKRLHKKKCEKRRKARLYYRKHHPKNVERNAAVRERSVLTRSSYLQNLPTTRPR